MSENDVKCEGQGAVALPADYFELRCLMMDQFAMGLLDLTLPVATAVATAIDAMTGRIHRSEGDAAAVYSIALGLLARHAPEALLPKYAEKAEWLAALKDAFHADSSEDQWFLDDLRWVAQKIGQSK